MKKLSVLIALMLCVTIGGVYATWSYTASEDIYDAFAEAKVTIADAISLGSNGEYKIESNLVLTVEQANDDHEAELVFSSNNGEDIFLKVTFTPNKDAPQSIKENAILSELYFGTTTSMQYKMDVDGNYSETGTAKDIFTFANSSDGVFSPNVTWEEQADGTFVYTLDETALKDQIKLSQIFKLDTKGEHDAFRTALNGNIVARVTDGKVTQ